MQNVLMQRYRGALAEFRACMPLNAEESEGELRMLWRHCFGKLPWETLTQNEPNITDKVWDTFYKKLLLRFDGEPLLYVIGEAEFCGHVFHCDRRALIPRPETEQIIEFICKEFSARELQLAGGNILDMACGSGVGGLSLASYYHQEFLKAYLSSELKDEKDEKNKKGGKGGKAGISSSSELKYLKDVKGEKGGISSSSELEYLKDVKGEKGGKALTCSRSNLAKNLSLDLVDVSAAALNLARENALILKENFSKNQFVENESVKNQFVKNQFVKNQSVKNQFVKNENEKKRQAKINKSDTNSKSHNKDKLAKRNTPINLYKKQINDKSLTFKNSSFTSRINFIQSDLFESLCQQKPKTYALIFANLPYVKTQFLNTNVDLEREPRLALDGGEDGLTLYRHFFAQVRNFLCADSLLVVEHGLDQGAEIRALAKKANFTQVETKRDLAGLDRFTLAKL